MVPFGMVLCSSKIAAVVEVYQQERSKTGFSEIKLGRGNLVRKICKSCTRYSSLHYIEMKGVYCGKNVRFGLYTFFLLCIEGCGGGI